MNAGAVYNEIDGFAAAWLRNLAAAAHIAPGAVDERSIADLAPNDVRGAVQFHAFAGIGGWSYALRLAGWPDDRPVWTGSCPCQPFSVAGRGRGTDDERHLWPEWFRLIRECRPAIVLGEQVASPAGLAWLDAVFADLEGEGYACGAADLCAAGVGAPHLRQRLYFVAVAGEERRDGGHALLRAGRPQQDRAQTAGRGEAGDVADADAGARRQGGALARGGDCRGGALARPRPGSGRSAGDVGDAVSLGIRDAGRGAHGGAAAGVQGEDGQRQRIWDEPRSAGVSSWSDAEWLACRDGKLRCAQPGAFPLAHGLPASLGRMQSEHRRLAEVAGLDRDSRKRAASNRVGRLRGSGNAIVPELAAMFVRAVMGGR